MKDSELREVLEEIRAAVAGLLERVTALEGKAAPTPAAPTPVAEATLPRPGVTEEIVLAITAAVAAYLGERAHVRQIRLISSSAWAQQGRVSVQASHRLAR